MLQLIGIASGLIGFFASIPYIIEIIKGRTKPQRMAWVIFLTLSGISFFAQLVEGATASLWFPLVLFVQAIIIFALTIKFGVGGASRFDFASLFLAVLIMLVWWATSSPALAIVCSVVVNTIGKVLVAIKVYKQPYTEYVPTWVWSAVASFLAVVAVGEWDWILILTPLQNGITVALIAWLILYRRTQVKESSSITR